MYEEETCVTEKVTFLWTNFALKSLGFPFDGLMRSLNNHLGSLPSSGWS